MRHIPVMVSEVMKYLNVKEGGTYIDATAGAGGHLQRIIEKVGEKGRVIAIDQNKAAVEYLKKKYSSLLPEQGRRGDEDSGRKPFDFAPLRSGGNAIVVRGNYKFIEKIAEKFGIVGNVDGILFDLGFSSDEIAEKGRGFSFEDDESLDMRYGQGDEGEFLDSGITAEEVVNTFTEKELADVFWRYGDERKSRFFAKKIVEYRHRRRIKSAAELAYVIGNAHPTFDEHRRLSEQSHARSADGRGRERFQIRLDSQVKRTVPYRKIHPATRAFMALRIFVNQEFENLRQGLEGAVRVLRPGGRCVVIAFHSGEDKIVKEFIKEGVKKGRIENLTKHVIKPSRAEVLSNRLARSAVMRVFERI